MKYPFTLNRRKIVVFVEIHSFEIGKQFKFILDTEASKSVIDESVAMSLGFDLKKLETERFTAIGGGKKSKLLKLPKLILFGNIIENFEVNVLEIPHQTTFFADGLIGMDFLLHYRDIKFDFIEKNIETN
jgi:predicted aspartyl protease